MKRELFIPLLKQIKKSVNLNDMQAMFAEEKDDLSWVFQLTDEKVKSILEEKQEGIKLAKMYLYLKKDRLPEQYKKFLEKAVREKNDNIVAVLYLFETEKLTAREDSLEFVKEVSSAKNAYRARDVACNPNVLKREDALEFVKEIDRAKGYFQANYASIVARNPDVLQREDALEFVKVVASAKEDYQSGYARDVACNPEVLQREDALEFVEVVASAEESYQVYYAYWVTCNVNVLKREDALEFVKEVARAKEIFQAKCASEVACNPNVLKREDALDIVKKIATMKLYKKVQRKTFELFKETGREERGIQHYSVKSLINKDNVDMLLEGLEQMPTDEVTEDTDVVVKVLK